MKMKRWGFAIAVVIMGGGAAFAAEPAKMAGGMWTDANGMTLYTYDKDAAGQSNCYDKCAVNWPPLKADAGAAANGEWSVVERKDGSKMWAYKGQPLYTFIGDKKAGDVNGDGKGGVWHVAK
jgi:predicted lipoprotein with Yx(FWY)xxD motif